MTTTPLASTMNLVTKSTAKKMMGLKSNAQKIINQKNQEIQELKNKISNYENILTKSFMEKQQLDANGENENQKLKYQLEGIKQKHDFDMKLLQEKQKNEKEAVEEQYNKEIEHLKKGVERAKEQKQVYNDSKSKASSLLNWSIYGDKNSTQSLNKTNEIERNNKEKINKTKAENNKLNQQLLDMQKQLQELMKKQRELLSNKTKKLETKITKEEPKIIQKPVESTPILKKEPEKPLIQEKPKEEPIVKKVEPVKKDVVVKKKRYKMPKLKTNKKKELQELLAKQQTMKIANYVKQCENEVESLKQRLLELQQQTQDAKRLKELEKVKKRQEQEKINDDIRVNSYLDAEIIKIASENRELLKLLHKYDKMAYGKK